MPNVLLIDDDTELASALKEVLELQGFSVITAETGSQGLASLQSEKFDLILLDWQLPDMQGVDVARRYRHAGGCGRILMLTGMRDAAARQAGKDAGADDFLTKPFTIDQLLARVADNLKH